ncbi:hypothetical protein EJ05DRAFT_300449 [Pseudovirgaria hyperparasitica]|uniref:DUF6594 domain-containing protein n=1 Tax=Pseudovirgaria hyperparasitica TaxID=470096 RepID=A0A6A6WCD2_9PEZI|nr:uncharacterized protein EJ05DRAFT_300449 [Pseudovirgaria hyperparasitica]KAF2759506.1 hypothetical protein EJ05DRAFT_300449 [Pseudovirgaria hyperparasitica]
MALLNDNEKKPGEEDADGDSESPTPENDVVNVYPSKASRSAIHSGLVGLIRSWLAKPYNPGPKPIINKLNEYPRGYPHLAAFLDSHENFMIYRRFGYLQARLILRKQDELRELEDELKDIDTEVAMNHKERLTTRMWDSVEQKKLMKKIESNFRSYASLLQSAQAMNGFTRPKPADYNSVSNYIQNRRPLWHGEDEWILHQEDMVTLRAARGLAWLDSLVEGLIRTFACGLLQKIFTSKDTETKFEDCKDWANNEHAYDRKDETYYTSRRITNFSNGILVMLILILPIVPISIMYYMIREV